MVMGEIERLDPPQRLGNVTLLATLGEGGMATVFLASVGQDSLTRLAAVKLLREGLADHDYRTRFMDEAKLVLRLHHNNIVDVREAGEIDSKLFIVMALIEGRDLADIWDRCAQVGKAFPVPLAVHIVREILRGLHYAHTFPGLGLVHRDVSPSNILVDWQGAVRLADFGLATSTLKGSLTAPGVVFGKVGYMSPEQARREVLDGRTDVYACAAVLWELLTGRPLRAGENIDTEAVSNFVAPAPSSLSSRVDPELDAIVVKALAHNREDRYLSAHEFMEALSDWLAAHSAGTGQEQVSEFMAMLFGDAQMRERQAREKLVREISRTHVYSHEKSGEEEAAEDEEIELDVDVDDPGESDNRPNRVNKKPPPHDPRDIELIEPKTVIAERYEIVNQIGRGGMGTVYLGEHTTVGRRVAIKVLTHQWSRNELVAKRFRAEARAASAAGHPNIIEVFDAGELPDGRLYLVMEYLTGRNLYDEIQDLGTLQVGRACRIIRAVARAIRAAHDVGIIHRDLKPDNVMFVPLPEGEGETVKVLDFGISAGAERTESQARLTVPGHALGTPEYMAPEQAKGKDATEAFDIYALGVMLYEVLVGEPPFVSNNLVEIMARKSTERAPSLGEKRPDLSKNLISLVDDCLEIDPKNRPATARDFLVRMDEVMRGLPVEERVGLDMTDASLVVPPTHSATQASHDDSGEFEGDVVPVDRLPSSSTPSLNDPNTRKLLAAGIMVVGTILLLWGLFSPPDTEVVADTGPPASDSQGADSDGNVADTKTSAGQTSAGQTSSGRTTAPKTSSGQQVPPKTTNAADPTGGPEPTTAGDPTTGGPTGEPTTGEPTTDDPTTTTGDPTTTTGGSTNKAPDTRYNTPECKQTVAAALEARKAGDFRGMLTHLKKRYCWKSKRDNAKLQTQAFKETKQFARCIKAGKKLSDPEVKSWVKLCTKRLEIEGG